MTDRELDRLLRRALLDANRAEEPEPEVEFSPSPRHRRQMRAMLRDPLGWVRRRERPAWRRVLQQAAVVLLVLTLGFGAAVAALPPVRAAVVRWVREVTEHWEAYYFSGSREGVEIVRYAITAPPEGFEETDWEKDPDSDGGSAVYTDKTGQTIRLAYVSRPDEAALWSDLDGDEILELEVYGMEARLCLTRDAEQPDTLTWMDEAKKLQFYVSGCVDRAAILSMAESVQMRLPVYGVTWLPEGFTEIERYTDEMPGSIYADGLGKEFCFNYCFMQEGLVNYISDIEDATIKDLQINGDAGRIYIDNDGKERSGIIWFDEKNHLMFSMFATCDAETLIRMAESVMVLDAKK